MKNERMPFHKWKDMIIEQDKKVHGMLYIREKEWYYREYGRYCNRVDLDG